MVKGCDILDVIRRIRDLMDERGWTEYRLAKNSSLSPSTIANIFRRNTVPGITTLESICGAFGISLSQFFAEGDFVPLTPEQAELLKKWSLLSQSRKDALIHLLDEMSEL